MLWIFLCFVTIVYGYIDNVDNTALRYSDRGGRPWSIYDSCSRRKSYECRSWCKEKSKKLYYLCRDDYCYCVETWYSAYHNIKRDNGRKKTALIQHFGPNSYAGDYEVVS